MDYFAAVKAARDATKGLSLPAPQELAAFQTVLSHILSTAGDVTAPETPDVEKPSRRPKPKPSPDADGPLVAIAEALGLDSEEVEILFTFADDDLVLKIPKKNIPDSNSKAVRAIAIVLTVAREAAGLPQTVEAVRACATTHGRYDVNNFSKDLSGVPVRQLKRDKDSLKVLSEGREVAPVLAASMVGHPISD